jgi:hypothetical protein
MKRFSAVLALGLLFPLFCFAQTQTGNASYNTSKTGLTISHPSLSFNTRVRVTNLGNNQSVEATVNGRIPISTDRIADISRDAGDALEMARTGMTLVEIAVLPPRQGTSAPEESPPPPAPAPRQQPPASPPPAPQAEAPAPVQIQPVQTIIEPMYIPAPASCPAQSCFDSPLLVLILCLLVLVIILLLVILILLLRRVLFWPKYCRVWFRRHLRYIKERRF